MNMDKIGSRKVVIVLEIKDYLFLSTKNKKSVWAVIGLVSAVPASTIIKLSIRTVCLSKQ